MYVQSSFNRHYLTLIKQVSHSLALSNMMPSGYRFGATFVGPNIVGPQESYPVLVGDLDPSGNLQAHIIHAPTSRTRFDRYLDDLINVN